MREKTRQLEGIDLNEQRQISLLEAFRNYYREMPFKEKKSSDLRYHFDNPHYSYSDAVVLYCMIRHLRPKRMIEIGSGYSSCVSLDTNELFLGNEAVCTFIDPDPQLLLSLIKDGDTNHIEILSKKVQDISVDRFLRLTAGDILLVDGSHVAKAFSDVNYIFFDVLPLLRKGVYIHFHDIFYPFDYPIEWLHEGRAWNEAYILRAFLQHNTVFAIEFFTTFLQHFYKDLFYDAMPICRRNPGGSIWISKST